MAVKQRWPAYRGCTLEPVYNGHPWDHAEWLLNTSGFARLGTQGALSAKINEVAVRTRIKQWSVTDRWLSLSGKGTIFRNSDCRGLEALACSYNYIHLFSVSLYK